MITTDFVTGSPCWLDLGAPDVTAAASFYGTVFGWDFERYTGDDAPEGMEYGTLKKDGHAVGAIGKLTEEGARPAWMLYFDTPDADATAQAVEKSGGSVRVPPMDAGDAGRMAQFTDPQGGQFAVWQPGKDRGLEVVDQPNSLCWAELWTTDSSAAKGFYSSLFNLQTQDMDLPEGSGTYSVIGPEGMGEDRMHGGVMEVPAEALALSGGRPEWHPVFAVADCDATAAKVTGNGGTLQMGPEDMPGVGRLAVCVDPSGADFVLLKPDPGTGGSSG
ncbi:VOC family protein [Streptomyces sp. NBC_01537]|uniref:VOC family protein n=1 Tax=Streptomyces sp. NBC_01537 TaxID=2903896 RepID=UPI00386F2A3F